MFGDILVSVVISALLFVWIALLLINEKEFEKRGIERSPLTLIFRSKKGLEAINREAKKRENLLRKIGNLAVIISAPLIVFVFVFLFFSAGHILKTPDSPPGLAPLLPKGVAEIPGAPSIPIGYWFLSIVTILVFHEIMHGLVARAEKIPLKSLGIFSVTLIPLGAFVEPDDEVLEKKAPMSKLRVYAAGSMGNFIAAFLTGLLLASLLFVVAPLSFQETGMKIFNVTANSPAARAGVEANLTLLAIDNVEIENLGDFRSAVSTLEPGVPVVLRTDRGDFEVTPKKREDFDRGVIGIAVLPTYKAKPYVAALIGEKLAFTIYGILLEALYWIATLNLAVGLTNLLPIFPLDGGRMFAVFAERIFPRTAAGITTFIYLVILVLVFINMGPLFGLF